VVIAGNVGRALTSTALVTVCLHPLTFVAVYEMVTVPAETPVDMRVLPTVATLLLLLLHVPPVVASVSAMVAPPQWFAPVMAATVGSAFTVITDEVVPPGAVYVILAVPLAIPVPTPVVLFTVALVVALLLHVPLGAVLVSAVMLPTQTASVPPMAPG